MISRLGFVKKVISVQKQQQRGGLLGTGLLVRVRDLEQEKRLLLGFRGEMSVAAVYYDSTAYVT